MKTFLVTGGAGFLGSNLCERLLALNHKVICVDNLQTGRIENIDKLKKNDNFKFIMHDITHKLYLPDQVHGIYNLACAASPPKYQAAPIHTMMTCTVGVKNMLDLALAKKARFLQASTSEVYGDPEIHPQPETYRGNVNPCGVRSCYDEGKRSAESLILDFHRAYELDYRIVRIFNTYGEKMDATDGRVVTNFINQAIRNKPITIYGDGKQTRSLCYVQDNLDGMIKFMEQDTYQGIVNLGNPQEITMNHLADVIIKLTDSKSEIVHMELPKDDPKVRCPDISKIMQIIDWQPKTDYITGLRKTIEYYRSL